MSDLVMYPRPKREKPRSQWSFLIITSDQSLENYETRVQNRLNEGYQIISSTSVVRQSVPGYQSLTHITHMKKETIIQGNYV